MARDERFEYQFIAVGGEACEQLSVAQPVKRALTEQTVDRAFGSRHSLVRHLSGLRQCGSADFTTIKETRSRSTLTKWYDLSMKRRRKAFDRAARLARDRTLRAIFIVFAGSTAVAGACLAADDRS